MKNTGETSDEFDNTQRTESPKKQLSGVQRILETGLLFFSVLAMFLMLALFSFDPADPGWAQTGYQTPVRNLGGAVGAYISDLLLNLFGYIAYTLPFVVAMLANIFMAQYMPIIFYARGTVSIPLTVIAVTVPCIRV